MDSRPRSIFDEIEEPFEPESLKKFGHLLKRLVTSHSDFRLLMYIDVLEFENRHFRNMFEGLAASLRRRFKPYFERLRREGERFKREIAGSRLVVFDNCGHIPQVEKAAEFNAAVLKFLAGETQ